MQYAGAIGRRLVIIGTIGLAIHKPANGFGSGGPGGELASCAAVSLQRAGRLAAPPALARSCEMAGLQQQWDRIGGWLRPTKPCIPSADEFQYLGYCGALLGCVRP